MEITHANLNHLIRWHCETFSVTRYDRASHLAGLGFDAAGWEIWPYLSAGAAICLAAEEVRSSPASIQQWMLREGITIGFVPTVHAAPMMKMHWPETSLRFLLTGGDALQHGPAVKLDFDVVNNYGPTETTVVATTCVLTPAAEGAPPIGHAITGATVYLLDENGQPVPDNTPGEIYVGGDGVARGYRNLPDSTARSFLRDPFSAAPGARMYRTGDRGIRRPDGEIEFRGRIDRQVKIRGQRVELDEISSLLISHPAIDFATVTANAVANGDNQLTGYVLAKENMTPPAAQELQEYLADRLPNYMVPSMFVRLDAIPVSANGKLDLKLLPKANEKNLLRQMATRADLRPIEKKLLATVRALLENSTIEIEDNYLLAGGHSLLGMQLLTRVRQAFGVDLSLRQIYESPTVERLAGAIEAQIHQKQILAMWTDLLQRNHIGLDDNFFTVGGTSDIARVLQERIAKQFGRTVSVQELLQNPTVRLHAELARSSVTFKSALPHGVIPLQPNGSKESFFWVQNLNVGLARAMGEERPFLFVGLYGRRFRISGQSPFLALHCGVPGTEDDAGAAEWAVQPGWLQPWRNARVRNGFTAMVCWTPGFPAGAGGSTESFVSGIAEPTDAKVEVPGLSTQKSQAIGSAVSLRYFADYVNLRFARLSRAKVNKPELKAAHELIESGSHLSRREVHGKGTVGHGDRASTGCGLSAGMERGLFGRPGSAALNGHHRDLLVEPAVQTLADAILSRLDPVAGEHLPMR